jgi:hypothetical protein
MVTEVTVTCKTKKAASDFTEAINEALDLDDDPLATASDRIITVTWGEELDSTELFEALVTARESMDWEF